jgi:hypothetical protein
MAKNKKLDSGSLLAEIKRLCKVKDIDYVLVEKDSKSYQLNKNWFLEKAALISYDSGFGGQIINGSLKIVLKDGSWIERGEYDWFELKSKPAKAEEVLSDDIYSIFQRRNNCTFNACEINGQSIGHDGDYKTNGYWKYENGKVSISRIENPKEENIEEFSDPELHAEYFKRS